MLPNDAIVEWVPTLDLRWYVKGERYAPVLQRKFVCTTADGLVGTIWAKVFPDATFTRVERTE